MPTVCARFVDCHVFRRPAAEAPRHPIATSPFALAHHHPAAVEWLVLRRAPHILLGGTWQMVSGNIDDGEPAWAAAYRELHEETGLTPVHFYQASYVNRFYLARSDEIVLSPVFAAEVPADAEVRLSDEHTDHAWVDLDEALRRYPWPGQRLSLRIIHEQFVERAPIAESCLDGLVAERWPDGVPTDLPTGVSTGVPMARGGPTGPPAGGGHRHDAHV